MEFVNLLASKQGRQPPRRLRQPLTSIRFHADDADDFIRTLYQLRVTEGHVDKVDRTAGFIARDIWVGFLWTGSLRMKRDGAL